MGSVDLTKIPNIDWGNPDETVDNKKIFSVRCKVAFSNIEPGIAKRADSVVNSENAVDLSDTAKELGVELQERVIIDDGEGILLPEDATGDTGSNDEVNWGDMPLMSGIASSTSVDFYGTEMSLNALKQMAVQMMKDDGIPYLPRHNNGSMGAVEWDEVIGRTVHAEVVPVSEVRKSFNPAESQYVLNVTTRMFPNEQLTENLVRRVSRGENIGQSIGGWFTELQVVQNDDGEVERVIVQGVELDHLAITRSPANPDSVGLVNIRSRLQEDLNTFNLNKSKEVDVDRITVENRIGEGIVSSMNERHIEAWQDNGDGTMTIVFALTHEEEDHSQESEMPHDEEVADEESSYKKKKNRDSLFADLPMADESMEWSFTSEEALEVLYYGQEGDEPNWERYKEAHAYYDASNDDHESGYKLPIAKMIDGELRVVWRGVAAAMAALNGARGGVDIPESERQKVYETLTMYYNKFEKEVPELAELTTLDNLENEEQHSTDDAGTSAPDEVSLTQAGSPSETSEEFVMNDEQIEILRSMLTEFVQPLVERVNSLEDKAGESEVNDERVASLEQTAREAVARAEQAERKLEELAAQPNRKGVAQAPVEEKKVTAADKVYSNAPNLTKKLNEAEAILADAAGNRSYVNRTQLETALGSLFDAAAEDGILINPIYRNSWK